MSEFSIIVAVDEAGGIGRQEQLPWRLPGELKHFREVTVGTGQNAVIMGRTTWLSIPEKHRPLANRINIVMSRTQSAHAGAQTVQSFDEALLAAQKVRVQNVFVIGGASVYTAALGHPACATLYVTRVQGTHECDTFFPDIPSTFHLAKEGEPITEAGETYWYEEYRRHPKILEEIQNVIP